MKDRKNRDKDVKDKRELQELLSATRAGRQFHCVEDRDHLWTFAWQLSTNPKQPDVFKTPPQHTHTHTHAQAC